MIDIKKYYIRKKLRVSVVVGHCINGNYLLVPPKLFGTDTIFMGKDSHEFQLNGILEQVAAKNIITQESIDVYKKQPVIHLVKHSSNGNTIIKLHMCLVDVYIDTLDDESLKQMDLVTDYIKLRQDFYDYKRYMKWTNYINTNDHLRSLYKLTVERYNSRANNLETIREKYLAVRNEAKLLCGSKERFDAMVRFYWTQKSCK